MRLSDDIFKAQNKITAPQSFNKDQKNKSLSNEYELSGPISASRKTTLKFKMSVEIREEKEKQKSGSYSIVNINNKKGDSSYSSSLPQNYFVDNVFGK